MIVDNNYKSIIEESTSEVVGRLFHYLIDNDGNIKCAVILIEYEEQRYVYSDNILSIDNDSIVIDHVSENAPTEECHIIYPDAVLLVKDGERYGNANTLEIEDKTIKRLHTQTAIFDPKDIVESSQFYITFSKEAEPEPGPTPPPTVPDELSLQYEPILGKTATASLYSHCNTPIIVKGETVTIANIISAIAECKLIKLLQIIE